MVDDFKRIIILPVFNEEKHLEDLLDGLTGRIDVFIVINDGSVDSSEEEIFKWAKDKDNFYYLKSASNNGMARALKRGLSQVMKLLEEGHINRDDIIITMDADGQHNPDYIDDMVRYMQFNKLDVLLAKRDLSNYPCYRKLGNMLLTSYVNMFTGYKYHDVESGFRLLRASLLPEIMRYYAGYRYSNAQEIAMITAIKNYKIDNSYIIKTPYYRKGGPGFIDVLINITMSTIVFLKVKFRKN
ncbi:MAG: glycosyltransferase family 2 protein [Candidatus Orphnella occulta]|nr:glycosyltransferase family 2 protein [Candidatus Orphnella occulta]